MKFFQLGSIALFAFLFSGLLGQNNVAARPQPIKFSHNAHTKTSFKITKKALDNLEEEEIPSELLKDLVSLKKQPPLAKEAFIKIVKGKIGADQMSQYNNLILKYAIKKGISCSTCHRFFKTQTNSGYPNQFICMDCHTNKVTDNPEEEKLRQFDKEKRPLIWTRVTKLPSHVRYSHKRHVVVGKLECVTCHGGIAKLTEPPSKPLVDITMNFCIDCHKTRHFEINRRSLRELKKQKFDFDGLKKIKTIQGQKFNSETTFYSALDKILPFPLSEQQRQLISKHTYPSKPITTDCIACHR